METVKNVISDVARNRYHLAPVSLVSQLVFKISHIPYKVFCADQYSVTRIDRKNILFTFENDVDSCANSFWYGKLDSADIAIEIFLLPHMNLKYEEPTYPYNI